MFENFSVPSALRPADPRFGCGPSLIPVEHLQRLAQTGVNYMGTSHRRDAVKHVVREVQEGLQQYFALPNDYEVVLGNGGATFYWDMIGLGLVEKSSFHFVCGEFSEKWFKAHRQIPWLSSQAEQVPYGEGINPREVAGFDLICATLNETSTGVQLNQIPQLKSAMSLMAIDATSGAGQIEVDFRNVDLYYFSPQKVFASDGGLYVSILSPKALKRAQAIAADKSRFIPESLKWTHAIENSRNHQTYNTPALATIFLLNEQIKRLNQLGQAEVVKSASAKAQLLYQWAESKSYLTPFVKDATFRSQSVATIDVDPGYKVDDLTKRLRELGVAQDIEGYRKLGRNQLRIAFFHNVALADLEKLTQIISAAIESA